MTITHATGSYPIRFLSVAEALGSLPDSAVVIFDENTRSEFEYLLPGGLKRLSVPPGEASKDPTTYVELLGDLARRGARRTTPIVAVGGGVIGDLVGFVAATYMRGVPFIQVPTTLLAMVDSSVGGKVGIDLPEGKNLVGAFKPPVEVRLPIDALASLPDRELRCGLAEVLKYAFIMDAPLLDLLSAPLPNTSEEWETIVRRCIQLKAEVVMEDEFETTGRRAILNFGHTIGHAIERLTHYGPVKHGEAVAIGMVAEAALGEKLGVTRTGTADEVASWVASHGLPIGHPLLGEPEQLVQAMQSDKKATEGGLAFSLLTQIGACKLVTGLAQNEVIAHLQRQ